MVTEDLSAEDRKPGLFKFALGILETLKERPTAAPDQTLVFSGNETPDRHVLAQYRYTSEIHLDSRNAWLVSQFLGTIISINANDNKRTFIDPATQVERCHTVCGYERDPASPPGINVFTMTSVHKDRAFAEEFKELHDRIKVVGGAFCNIGNYQTHGDANTAIITLDVRSESTEDKKSEELKELANLYNFAPLFLDHHGIDYKRDTKEEGVLKIAVNKTELDKAVAQEKDELAKSKMIDLH